MRSETLRSSAWKCALLAVAVTLAPSIWAQQAVPPGSSAFDLLPLAPSPALRDAQELSGIRIPDASSRKPVRTRRDWMLLSIASHSAATFDAYSTRRAIGSGAVEMDPMMKPFANSPSLYFAIQASPLLMDFAAYQMQHSRNHFLRRMWWAPQSVGTAVSFSAGIHNMQVAGRK